MEYVNDMLTQLTALGPEALTVLIVIAFAYVLRPIKRFPNALIPAFCVLLGAVLYPLIAKPIEPSAALRHPAVRLVMVGALIGLLAWVAHNKVLKRIEDRFPVLKGALSDGNDPPEKQPPSNDGAKPT